METRQLKEYVPGLAGVPAVKSRISFIDGFQGLLAYRGIPIEQLARHSTFEETTWLLIHGALPTRPQLDAWSGRLRQAGRLPEETRRVLEAMPRGGHPMKALQAGVAALGMSEPVEGPYAPPSGKGAALGATRERQDRAIVRLIATLPTILAAFHRLRSVREPVEPREDLDLAANFLWMLSGEEPDPLAARVLDVCLILHAEHSINASTMSALVTASTLADPYAVISSAIGTLAGELHGGANERVLAMLRAIGTVEAARAFVEERIDSGAKIMGVGHRVYKIKDPRAIILQELTGPLFERLGATRLYDIALEVERVVADRLGDRGICPNVDFYSGILYDRMGIPAELFTPIFALSRVAGWLAHWVEQLEDNKLFRPTQIFEGPSGLSYIPIAQRS